ncbi:Gfo/Idh/MocA family protein [Fimbriimonas ginsengisoli]|uniref:Dehydrogenase n=1 Tax=Fimbriimonas ginsengisoli Gsoil 348 TaxID=661478 RepID=A0A068NU08_FIMGI|nr:Gfo/Idh/MocA family oxidoreductase [Fimbriimonas ginsengisoli]AIE86857.1 dehydrogenase [Fimbriimonas ginsengisoli Gsoil 348]
MTIPRIPVRQSSTANRDKMNSMVRLGVVGLGNMGSGHVAQMSKVQRCELTAVCDIDEAKLAKYPQFKQFGDSREMIRSGDIDAVLIAVPHYDHTTIAIDAFENGVHVLTEKPVAVHKADAQRMIDAHAKTNLVFGAMFNQRTDPHYQEIRRVVRSGELGEIQRTNWIITNWFRTATYYASGGWRATWRGEGGGVLLNQCPHNLDLFQWICGMPSRVRAYCGWGKYHDIEVEDEVTAYLEYPNGATGVFVTTTGEAPGTNRLEIVGDRGKLVYEDGKILFTRTNQSVREVLETSPESFASVPTSVTEIEVDGYGGQHVEMVQNFVDAILDGKPLLAPAPEGIHSVELANAMLFSAWTDRTIDIPLDAAAYEAALKEHIATSRYEKKAVVAAEVDLSKSWA